MTRTKSIIGALAVCALSICAFAAASAPAAQLTAVECLNKGAGSKYPTSECVTPTSSGNFETEAIKLNTKTSVTAENTGNQPATLRATVGGLKATVICKKSSLVAPTVENSEPSAGVHKITSAATRATYSECHAVLESKETRICGVTGVTGPGGADMISTAALKSETTNVNHQVKVEPNPAGTFTEFTIAKKGTYPATENECWTTSDIPVVVTGFVEGEVNTDTHAHLTFTEANNGGNLKVGGVAAKYLDTLGGKNATTGAVVGAQTFT